MPIKSQLAVVSDEEVTTQGVLPTMNCGFDPKFAPVKSKDVAPEAEVGETVVISGVTAVEKY